MIFQWNNWNKQHIGEHSVSLREAEFIVEHAKPPFPRAIEDEKHLVWGRCESGRFLQVIFLVLSDDQMDFSSLSASDRLRFEDDETVAMIIHARDMNASEKQQLHRLKRH